MAHVRTPRVAWIEAAMRALAAGGPEAIKVEPLAVQLGVSKGGFYWHFTGREDLLGQLLDHWEKAAFDDVIDGLESQPTAPLARLQQLFVLASEPGALALELAMRDWSRRDAAVAERLNRVDTRRMDYLRSLFAQVCADADDVEVRSLMAFSLFVSSNVIAVEHPHTTRARVLQLAADRLLSWPPA